VDRVVSVQAAWTGEWWTGHTTRIVDADRSSEQHRPDKPERAKQREFVLCNVRRADHEANRSLLIVRHCFIVIEAACIRLQLKTNDRPPHINERASTVLSIE